jgi:AcrR family transcriptional regulator
VQAEGTTERPARGRGRRPADEVRADVFRVVGEVLLKEGIADLTFERVARLSGVSKTTLYKWWPSKGALALDGYFHAVEETLAFEDSGDIRYSSERRRLAGERLLRAKEQGQIRDDVDVQILVDQLWGAVYHRMLVPDEPVTDDFVVALVSNLIDGITP